MVIAVRRLGVFSYIVNIYANGRAMFQSMACPCDCEAHQRQLSASDMSRLIQAFRARQFTSMERDCLTEMVDAERYVVGFYDDTAQKTVVAWDGTELGDPDAAVVLNLANFVDVVVRTGDLVH